MQDGTIDRPDIITSKGFTTFEDLKKQIDEATVSLAKFIDTGKQAGVNIKGATTTRQLGEETKKLTIQQAELLKIEKQIEVANARATKAYQDQQKALVSIKNEQKERLALGNKEAKQVTELNSSVKQLEAALNKNRVAYKSLADEEARNSKEGKELKAIIDQQDIAVKKLNESVGDHTDSVGHYEKGMKGLKLELKEAKDQMAILAKTSGTTSAEFVKAAAKAGDLKDQINDINDQIKITAGNKFETIGNSLKDVGSKLISLDFEGAANSAKQFASVMKTLTFKELTEGLKSFGSTIATVSKAIITSPLFIMASVIAGVVLAFQYFKAQSERLSQRQIENYAKETEAMEARYNLEIRLQKLVGKSTFDLEIEKQKRIKENADRSIQALGDVNEFSLKSLFLEGKLLATNKDKQKQLEEFMKTSRDAGNEIIALTAEQAKFQEDTSKETAEQQKKDLFELNKFRLQVQIDGQKDIIDNQDAFYGDRLNAVKKFTKLKNQLAKLEFENAKDQANLTAEALLLIDAQLQKDLADNRKDAGKEVETINKQLNEGIQANMKKAGDAISGNLKKPIDDTSKQIEKLEGEVGDMGVTFEHVTDNAGFKFREFFSELSIKLQKAKEEFSAWAGAITDLFNNLTAGRIQNLEIESRKNKEKLDKDLILAGDNEKAKEQIQLRAAKAEAELEKKRRAEARKAAILDKVFALVAAAINTALAITNQLKGGDPYTAFARAAAAGILGGLQVAAIAVKPIPAYQFGTKKGESHPGGPARVGEVGSELMIKPGGGLELTPSVSTIMNVPRGTEIVPHDKTMRMLAMGALQQNGGSRQVTNTDPQLLNEVRGLRGDIQNIRHPKQPSLVNSSGTVYGAFEDAKRNITVRRIGNMGPFFKHQ